MRTSTPGLALLVLTLAWTSAWAPPGGNGNGRLSQASLDMDTPGCMTFFGDATCAADTEWTVKKKPVDPILQDPDGTGFDFKIQIIEGPTTGSDLLTTSGSILLTNSGQLSAVLSSIVANLQANFGAGNGMETVATAIQVESDDCRDLDEARTCYGTFTPFGEGTLLLLDPLSNDVIALSDVLPIPASRPDDPLTAGNESCFDAVQIDFVATWDVQALGLENAIDWRVEVFSTFGSAGRRGNGGASCTIDANCNGNIDEDDNSTPLVDEAERRNIRTVQQRGSFVLPDCDPDCQQVHVTDDGATVDDDTCVGLDALDTLDTTVDATGIVDNKTEFFVGGDATCEGPECGTTITNVVHVDGEGCEGQIDFTPGIGSIDVECTGDPTIPVGDFATFPQGGWGRSCPGSIQGDPLATHPGCILEQHFACAFPGGADIGEGPLDGPPLYSAWWAAEPNVQAFLPAVGNRGTLTADLTNPLSTSAGVWGGQILSLELNVGFSCNSCAGAPVFETLGLEANTSLCLGELVLCYGGAFDGLTVQQLLDVANDVVSGNVYALAAFGASGQDLTNALTFINGNFMDGEANNNLLCLPQSTAGTVGASRPARGELVAPARDVARRPAGDGPR